MSLNYTLMFLLECMKVRISGYAKLLLAKKAGCHKVSSGKPISKRQAKSTIGWSKDIPVFGKHI